MEDRPRVNVISGVELETDDGRNSSSGLISAIVTAVVIVIVAGLVFGF
jgi:hypothetical protein